MRITRDEARELLHLYVRVPFRERNKALQRLVPKLEAASKSKRDRLEDLLNRAIPLICRGEEDGELSEEIKGELERQTAPNARELHAALLEVHAFLLDGGSALLGSASTSVPYTDPTAGLQNRILGVLRRGVPVGREAPPILKPRRKKKGEDELQAEAAERERQREARRAEAAAFVPLTEDDQAALAELQTRRPVKRRKPAVPPGRKAK